MALRSELEARLADDAAGLCALAVDYLLDRPVATFAEPERLDFWLDHAFDEGAIAEAVEAHARGLVERERARAHTRGDRVRDWLSVEAQAELRALAARPVVFERATLERWVDQDGVRSILQAVVRETLDRFVETVKPGGSGGGVFGAVGRGAIGFASRAGKGLLGGIGGQVEELLRGAVSGFVGSSMGLMVERFVGILMQPETQRQLGRMRLTAFERAMKTETAAILDRVAAEPGLDDLWEALPGLLAHNLDRPEVRQILRDELARWIEAEGQRPIRSFLPAARVEALRDAVAALAEPLVRGFVASPGFAAWADGGLTVDGTPAAEEAPAAASDEAAAGEGAAAGDGPDAGA